MAVHPIQTFLLLYVLKHWYEFPDKSTTTQLTTPHLFLWLVKMLNNAIDSFTNSFLYLTSI